MHNRSQITLHPYAKCAQLLMTPRVSIIVWLVSDVMSTILVFKTGLHEDEVYSGIAPWVQSFIWVLLKREVPWVLCGGSALAVLGCLWVVHRGILPVLQESSGQCPVRCVSLEEAGMRGRHWRSQKLEVRQEAPVCAWSGSIRSGGGNWVPDAFVKGQKGWVFSLGLLGP